MLASLLMELLDSPRSMLKRRIEKRGGTFHAQLRVSKTILEGPFQPDGVKDSALRERLRQAGFTEGTVRNVLEGRNDRSIDVQCAVRRTAEASPLHTLIRTFVLGMPVSEVAVGAALSPVDVEWLEHVGLIERLDDSVRAVARLWPWRDFVLLSDFVPPEGEPLRSDFVMSGTSASSMLLTRLTFRTRVRMALDLGTGAGIHALLAAAHAEHVVATDTNPRALNFARMNARLNGIDNVSFRQGSFFNPVRDAAFDLIVSNPPFMISPQSNLMFQNLGLEGDAVSELIVRESPAHLNDGGCAVSLISWQHENEDDRCARPCGWAAGSGCDLWLLRATSEAPLLYAANALRQTEGIHNARYGEELDRWVEYYRKHHITRLALGAVILRKRQGSRNWVRCEDLSGATVANDAGEQVGRVFAAETFLTGLSGEDELLDCRVVLHPEHVLEQRLVASDEGWAIQSLVLQPAHGLKRRLTVDVSVLAFLSQCKGDRTLRELLAGVASEAEVDFASVAATGLPLVRRLLGTGLLTITPPEGSLSAGAGL